MSHPHVGVGVGVFVFGDATSPFFVMGKRKGSLGAGKFALPGGHLEPGETFEACAQREVLEETGLRIVDVKFVTAVNTVFEDEGKHYVTIFMEARREDMYAQPELLEPEKCHGWKWISFEMMAEASGELFKPLISLIIQRPDECKRLRRGL